VSYAVCARCQKGFMFPTELHAYGQLAVSRAGLSAISTPAKCHTCGVCGHTEIYAKDSAKLRPGDYPVAAPGAKEK
jgi:hypothetical protein